VRLLEAHIHCRAVNHSWCVRMKSRTTYFTVAASFTHLALNQAVILPRHVMSDISSNMHVLEFHNITINTKMHSTSGVQSLVNDFQSSQQHHWHSQWRSQGGRTAPPQNSILATPLGIRITIHSKKEKKDPHQPQLVSPTISSESTQSLD